MGELSRENFSAKVATAPRAAQGFFETVIEHFNKRSDIHVRKIEKHSAKYGQLLSYLKEIKVLSQR